PAVDRSAAYPRLPRFPRGRFFWFAGQDQLIVLVGGIPVARIVLQLTCGVIMVAGLVLVISAEAFSSRHRLESAPTPPPWEQPLKIGVLSLLAILVIYVFIAWVLQFWRRELVQITRLGITRTSI